MFGRLKKMKIIPRNLSLKHTTCTVSSDDNAPLKILGKLNYPIRIAHPSNCKLSLNFKSFYVIEGLANSINLGKPILDEINAIWDFQKPTISIQGIDLPLTTQKEKNNSGKINQLIKTKDEDDRIYLYAKKTTYIPPKSSMIIQLKSFR